MVIFDHNNSFQYSNKQFKLDFWKKYGICFFRPEEDWKEFIFPFFGFETRWEMDQKHGLEIGNWIKSQDWNNSKMEQENIYFWWISNTENKLKITLFTVVPPHKLCGIIEDFPLYHFHYVRKTRSDGTLGAKSAYNIVTKGVIIRYLEL